MAEPWRLGDRVRLGDKRGGRIIDVAGYPRAIFPDLTLVRADDVEPDEDGNYFTRGVCKRCQRPHRERGPRDVFCVNCGEDPAPTPDWLISQQQKGRL